MSNQEPVAWAFYNADGSLRFIIDDKKRMEAWRSAHKGTIVPLVPMIKDKQSTNQKSYTPTIVGVDTYGIMVVQPRRNDIMKIVTISMELVIDEDMDESFIPQYLNDKLYTDPEFFGDFGSENITGVITVVEQSNPYWVLCVLLFC